MFNQKVLATALHNELGFMGLLTGFDELSFGSYIMIMIPVATIRIVK